MGRNSKKLSAVLAFVPLLIGVALIIVIAEAKKPKLPKETSQQVSVVRGPTQNVRFTLYKEGIYPRKLRAKSGNIIIAVEDRTGRSLGLVVEQQVETATLPVGQVSPVSKLRGRSQFILTAGRYVLFDASQPRNRAELLVEP